MLAFELRKFRKRKRNWNTHIECKEFGESERWGREWEWEGGIQFDWFNNVVTMVNNDPFAVSFRSMWMIWWSPYFFRVTGYIISSNIFHLDELIRQINAYMLMLTMYMCLCLLVCAFVIYAVAISNNGTGKNCIDGKGPNHTQLS